jgi:cytoskeletal protein RodZ
MPPKWAGCSGDYDVLDSVIANRLGAWLVMNRMPTVGEQLRAAREAQRLSVQEIAEITKLRTDHVRALEEGRFEVFTAPVYVRGFTRTYATLLKLEVPRLISELEAELEKSRQFPEGTVSGRLAPGPIDQVTLQLSRVNWRVALPVGIIALLIAISVFGYRAWQVRQSEDPLSGLGEGYYQSTQGVSGETLPLPTNPPPSR